MLLIRRLDVSARHRPYPIYQLLVPGDSVAYKVIARDERTSITCYRYTANSDVFVRYLYISINPAGALSEQVVYGGEKAEGTYQLMRASVLA
jgi:hypothetical protein